MDELSDAVAVLMSIVQDYNEFQWHGDSLLFAEAMEANLALIGDIEV